MYRLGWHLVDKMSSPIVVMDATMGSFLSLFRLKNDPILASITTTKSKSVELQGN